MIWLGIVKSAKDGKVAVFTCGIDIAQTETKGTVLLKNAEEMLNFTTGEEKHMEKVHTVLEQTHNPNTKLSLSRFFEKLPTQA